MKSIVSSEVHLIFLLENDMIKCAVNHVSAAINTLPLRQCFEVLDWRSYNLPLAT